MNDLDFVNSMILTIMFRYGRKKSSIIILLSHVTLQAILSLSPNYWFYVIFVFLFGIFHVMMYTVTFVWCKFLFLFYFYSSTLIRHSCT